MWAEDVHKFLNESTLQAAIIEREGEIVGTVVTEVFDYPRKRAIRLTLGAGSHLHEWGPVLNDVLQERAKEVGAELIEVHGRPGWVRYLKKICGAKQRTAIVTRTV